MNEYLNCKLCPRKCLVDRTKQLGFCKQSDKIKVAKIMLHMWEEPCISGTNGSGAIFFSGCTLKCCFCQNYEISHGNKGEHLTVNDLSDKMLELQEMGAHNINLVSPTPFVPSIIESLDIAKPKLKIPVVFNCGGYESIDTIEMLNGYVDIYLPDLKYVSNEYSKKYSGCQNYYENAIKAIKAMQKQVGRPIYNANGIMQKGVIVRHLVLPTLRHDSKAVIEALAKEFKADEIVLSLMSQYVPTYKACDHKEINRKISTFEYNFVLDVANSYGFEGFSQQREASSTAYIPEF